MTTRAYGTPGPGGWIRLGLVVAAGLVGLASLPLTAQQPANLFGHVDYRAIGPTSQGGRYVDYAVVEATPRIFYAATASGGLWKTTNHGHHWQSIFDDHPAFSLGAVAVAQSNPDIIYLGTGEANNSRSSYWGDGVYKSTDAGGTWTNVGLPESHHIGRIAVHPTNPDVAYVAALGHLYSENEERGVYKTTDGGATWTKSLGVQVEGRHIGAVDIAMHPTDPETLYAATYDKVRRPWTFAEGGPGSALHKTTDAGRTWTKLEGGLPTGFLGRIGVSISRSRPDTVYTVIEYIDDLTPEQQQRFLEGFGTVGGGEGRLYRSDDGGATWRQAAPAPAGGPGAGGQGRGGGRGGFDGGRPPYYYGQVRVDPNDPETVYVLSVGWSRSRDGGATWERIGFGGDNHALWINPADSLHMILGHDHGMGVTFDGGEEWFSPDNKPLAQFYAVGLDLARPYNVYGGTQDNGCWRGPSTMRGGGSIPFEAWQDVGCGDGFYNEVDWAENRWLYNESQFGGISRVDLLTGEDADIEYERPDGQEEVRFNWSAPILISPHDADTIYHGANVLLRSRTRGDTWEEISPDLTKNLPERRNGGGNIQYATLTTIDESSIVPGLIYVGTDDGNVQMTRDNGQTWTNVTDRLPGHPGYWISRVETSSHDAGVAYVSATGYRRDDFRPLLWKTSDYGETWASIADGLPNAPINVVREDHRNPNLLFVGAEPGVSVTIDGGQTWHDLSTNMPSQAVYDLKVHPRENELVVATHGRGFFIADISGLQGLTAEAMAAGVALMDVQPVVKWIEGLNNETARLNFNGESRPEGMTIHYYLQAAPPGDVTVRIYDGARMIAETVGPNNAGMNSVRWNLQATREPMPGETVGGRGRGGRGGGFGRGGGAGAAPAVPVFPAGGGITTDVRPGTYRVVLTVDGRQHEKPGVVLEDVWFNR